VERALLAVQQEHGTAFLQYMLEALHKPWMVRR
jgi:hypothetical protein